MTDPQTKANHLRFQLADALNGAQARIEVLQGLLNSLRANHPDGVEGYGVGQRLSGKATLALWHEVDATLAAGKTK